MPLPAYLCQTGSSSTSSWFCSGVPGHESNGSKEGECSIGDLQKHKQGVFKCAWSASTGVLQPSGSHSQLTLAGSAGLLFERIQVKDALCRGGLHPHFPSSAREEVRAEMHINKRSALMTTMGGANFYRSPLMGAHQT